MILPKDRITAIIIMSICVNFILLFSFLQIDEKWFKAFIFKTRALQKQKKFDEAIEAIRSILSFDEGKQKLVDGRSNSLDFWLI